MTAFVDEVFSSVQGEGPRIGERHIFVRFQGCNIRCRYCDTPAAIQPTGNVCRAQRSLASFEHEEVLNPMTGDVLRIYASDLLFLDNPGQCSALPEENLCSNRIFYQPGFRE